MITPHAVSAKHVSNSALTYGGDKLGNLTLLVCQVGLVDSLFGKLIGFSLSGCFQVPGPCFALTSADCIASATELPLLVSLLTG